MIRKLLIFLYVIQHKRVENGFNNIRIKARLNPLNPLSYITIILCFLTGFILFGALGIWKEIDLRNPFIYH